MSKITTCSSWMIKQSLDKKVKTHWFADVRVHEERIVIIWAKHNALWHNWQRRASTFYIVFAFICGDIQSSGRFVSENKLWYKTQNATLDKYNTQANKNFDMELHYIRCYKLGKRDATYFIRRILWHEKGSNNSSFVKCLFHEACSIVCRPTIIHNQTM